MRVIRVWSADDVRTEVVDAGRAPAFAWAPGFPSLEDAQPAVTEVEPVLAEVVSLEVPRRRLAAGAVPSVNRRRSNARARTDSINPRAQARIVRAEP